MHRGNVPGWPGSIKTRLRAAAGARTFNLPVSAPARLLAAAAAVAAILLAPASAALGSRSSERRAERLVSHSLAKRYPLERKVRCHRVRRGSRRLSCRWRGASRPSPNRTERCRGRARVRFSRRRGRVRARIRRGRTARCSTAVKALDPRFGFHDTSTISGRASPEQVAKLVEGTGAGLYRTPVDWRSLEPARDRYEFSRLDRLYKALRERGISPVFVLMWAPRWAWEPLTFCTGDCRLPPGRAFDGEWGQIAALLAARYPKAAGIEIWNEPNERTSWSSGPDVARYAELLGVAYRAIKQANPSMPVIGGGLSIRGSSGSEGISFIRFARDLLAVGANMDGFGIHPYPSQQRVGVIEESLGALRAISPRPLRFWATEVGITTSGPTDDPNYGTAAGQAAGLVDAYRTLRRQPDVDAVIVHTLVDPRNDPGDRESGFGVLRPDLSAKPAYKALARATGAIMARR
jgi:polysaccharide biosynthesis protein PslG